MQFENLILLIGTNPLPNFVVAEYYLQNNPELKNIWLVHSEKMNSHEGTYTYAENLVKVLKVRHPNNPVSFNFIPLSKISDANKISYDVRKLLISELDDNSSVHLNYTGGTKVMGIHVYHSLKQEGSKRLAKSFSYLDARSFRIVDDEENTTADLRDNVSPTFNELIHVHGFERKNTDSNNDFEGVMGEFRELIKGGKLKEFFHANGGYDRTIFESKNKRSELAEKIEDIDPDIIANFTPNAVFQRILSALPDNYKIFKKDIGKKFKRVIKFLDGGWFEEYIYKVLTENFKEPNVEILKDWEIRKNGWTGNFQLDVIMMRGYQLVGISCTTSKEKHICKSKGFEIIHRTRQIGGDEAKAVLFTFLDEGTKLDVQDELLIDTGSTTANILVFGIEDLNEDYIIRKIREFIK
jgi:hypothetical protein